MLVVFYLNLEHGVWQSFQNDRLHFYRVFL
jgi:hypothetical protein